MWRKVVVSVVVACCALSCLGFVALVRWARSPTDAEVQALFEANRPALEACVARLLKSGLYEVSTRYSAAYEGTEIRELRAELERLGLVIATRLPDSQSYLLAYWAFGMPGSSRKGVALMSNQPERLVGSLDGSLGHGEHGLWFRHLTGDWYMYFEQ
jgi:hypothetical protein